MGRLSPAYRHKVGPPAVGVAIAEFASRHHGVISIGELNALGLDGKAVERRVDSGFLHPLHRGVYAVGHPGISTRAAWRAAVLACGPRAALSHRSAAAFWGLRPSSGRIEITAPRSCAGPEGLRPYRSRMLDPRDFEVVDGIRVTTVARTLLDLAAVVPEDHLRRAVDRAERLELFDLTAVQDVLGRARGRRGAAALRRAIAGWQPSHTRSELEDRFLELVSAAKLPRPRTNVLLDGERGTHEVDAYWQSHRLAVQLDGFAYHRTRRDRERDAAGDADLELAGHAVLRLTWGDVTVHRDRTVRRLMLRVP